MRVVLAIAAATAVVFPISLAFADDTKLSMTSQSSSKWDGILEAGKQVRLIGRNHTEDASNGNWSSVQVTVTNQQTGQQFQQGGGQEQKADAETYIDVPAGRWSVLAQCQHGKATAKTCQVSIQ